MESTKIIAELPSTGTTKSSIKKYSAIDMFKCAPEFRESQVKVESTSALLAPDFFARCKTLFPTAECDEDSKLKRELNEALYEKAQKKHKNFLRRQRAKQAKIAQKERETDENADKVPEKLLIRSRTASLTGSDSGVSVKSSNSFKNQKNFQKNVQKTNQKTNQKISQKPSHHTQKLNQNQKVRTVQKFTVFKSEISTPEFKSRQPTFSGGFESNFKNQGKLRASTEDISLNDDNSAFSVFTAKPVTEARTWTNSRLNRKMQRGRIGSRS